MGCLLDAMSMGGFRDVVPISKNFSVSCMTLRSGILFKIAYYSLKSAFRFGGKGVTK